MVAEMSEPAILYNVQAGVAWLRLNQPATRNAINAEIAEALDELAERCASDPAVRCVMLTGQGDFFCVGGDISRFIAAREAGEARAIVHGLARQFNAGIYRLLTMNKPLVTVINGPAAGAGFGLALIGDVVLAARSAHLTAAYTAIGMTPDGGTSWMLPRLVGLRRAQRILFENPRISAEEASDLGLVTHVVPDERLAEEADALAARLASGATGAIGACRALLRASSTPDLAAHLALEAETIAAAAAGDEAGEGFAAFLERRTPRFPGV